MSEKKISINPCYYEDSLINKSIFVINHARGFKENVITCFHSNKTTSRNSSITYTHTHDPLNQTYVNT